MPRRSSRWRRAASGIGAEAQPLEAAPSDEGTAGLSASCLAHSDVVVREIDVGKRMGSRRTAFSSDRGKCSPGSKGARRQAG